MKIAFVTLGYQPIRTSGFDISGERLVDEILAAGHEVTVLAVGQPGMPESPKPGLSVYRIPIGSTNWIGYARRAAQALQQLEQTRRFDVVHFWDVHFAYAYPGQFVGTVHQSFHQRRTSIPSRSIRSLYYYAAEKLIERPAAMRADCLTAVSQATRAEFTQHYGVAPDRIHLVPHGINTGIFRPDETAGNIRARLGLSDEPVVLFAGFITPRKGIDILLRALPEVCPSPKLVLLGKWTPGLRERHAGLLAAAGSQVVEAGYVADEDMPDWYRAADIYISPSYLEGFGLPLAEALACGTPVVATDVGASREVVGNGGLLVPAGDERALAEAISSLLSQDNLRRRMGEAGRQHINKDYSLKAMRHAILEVYQQASRKIY